MLTLDCTRCPERQMTHDLVAISPRPDDLTLCEGFVFCRACGKTSVWLLKSKNGQLSISELAKQGHRINGQLHVLQPIRAKGSSVAAPDHTPADLKLIFDEGAECLAIGAWNASSAMFRKIIDHISKERLPDANAGGPTDRNTRFNLKPRLKWLFDNGHLPRDVEDLADCIREDANDAVHNHPIGKPEAEDILDFTVELLERLYTTPGRLAEAAARRGARRANQPQQ